MSNAGRRLRLGRRLYGTEREYSRRPYGVVLTTINPRRDQMTFEGPRSGRTIPIAHPYLGPTSWIRVMPERSTRMIINSRADSGEPFVVAYLAEDSAENALDSTYERNQFYYRRLREGEISIASPGIAEQHFARGGTMSFRAGPLTQVMNVERLEITSKAPTVITRALDHTFNEVSSEIRFGVAKRINSSDSTQDSFIKITPEGATEQVFAKEYLRNVQSKASPFTLVDHREGHVIDDSGSEETSMVTGKKLRSRTKWGTASARDVLAEIDVDGNVNVKLPTGASYGFNLEVEETDAKVIVGRDEMHNVGRNLMFDVTQSVSIEARDISMEAQTTTDITSTGPITIEGQSTIMITATGALTATAASLALAASSGGGIGVSGGGGVSLGTTDGAPIPGGQLVKGGVVDTAWQGISTALSVIPVASDAPAPTASALANANKAAILAMIVAFNGALSSTSSTQ